jgi:hypothetical protein
MLETRSFLCVHGESALTQMAPEVEVDADRINPN